MLNALELRPLTQGEIDQWPVANSGLTARVVHCLEQAGVQTIGELRHWDERRLVGLRHFGETSLENVRWFFQLASRMESGKSHFPNMRGVLKEFLNRQQIFVVEQRYGLTDPRFRPQDKRRTLQEIAKSHGALTRERVRQVEQIALERLRTRLCRAVLVPIEVHCYNRIQAQSCVVTSRDLEQWVDDPVLGGYQPWGTLMLLTDLLDRIVVRNDYFSCLSGHILNQVEKQILQLLSKAREPLSFEKILGAVSDDLSFLNGQRLRLLTVMLDHHPEISGTTDRRYFLPALSAPLIVADILRNESKPLHFHEVARLYNDRMQPHSRKGTGYILRVLNTMSEASRVTRAVYELKKR
jgi:hypothetical protein